MREERGEKREERGNRNKIVKSHGKKKEKMMKYSQRIILLVVLSRERRIKFCQRKKKREAVTKLRKKAFKKLRETKK